MADITYERNDARAFRIVEEELRQNRIEANNLAKNFMASRIAKELDSAEKRGVQKFLARLQEIVEETE